MSTGKTAHLGLNQWVLDDPLLMEEVNEDNRRIDAAIAPLAMEKIGEIITTQTAQQLDLDVSGIDWDRYLKVMIYFAVNVGTIQSGIVQFKLLANNRNGSADYSFGNTLQDLDNLLSQLAATNTDTIGHNIKRSFELIAYPAFNGCVFMMKDYSIFQGYSTDTRWGALRTSPSNKVPLPLNQLNTLNFLCINSSFAPGCEFYLYGVRK